MRQTKEDGRGGARRRGGLSLLGQIGAASDGSTCGAGHEGVISPGGCASSSSVFGAAGLSSESGGGASSGLSEGSGCSSSLMVGPPLGVLARPPCPPHGPGRGGSENAVSSCPKRPPGGCKRDRNGAARERQSGRRYGKISRYYLAFLDAHGQRPPSEVPL